MGIVEIHRNRELIIHSHLVTYGNAGGPAITEYIREEIEAMWNEPKGTVYIGDELYSVRFRISSAYSPAITALDIYQDVNPRNNYFRIEAFAHGHISFVDGLGCNSGYFLIDNLYKGSTTAAHEYGHTLGLEHPHHIDLRGKGVPGIMSPRGTLADPQYQYNPHAAAGDSSNGGTMHPIHRRVRQDDIAGLKLEKLEYDNGIARIGDFSSVWHPDHAEISSADYLLPINHQYFGSIG